MQTHQSADLTIVTLASSENGDGDAGTEEAGKHWDVSLSRIQRIKEEIVTEIILQQKKQSGQENNIYDSNKQWLQRKFNIIV